MRYNIWLTDAKPPFSTFSQRSRSKCSNLPWFVSDLCNIDYCLYDTILSMPSCRCFFVFRLVFPQWKTIVFSLVLRPSIWKGSRFNIHRLLHAATLEQIATTSCFWSPHVLDENRTYFTYFSPMAAWQRPVTLIHPLYEVIIYLLLGRGISLTSSVYASWRICFGLAYEQSSAHHNNISGWGTQRDIYPDWCPICLLHPNLIKIK